MKHSNINFGRPWSGWVGTNVIHREIGLIISVNAQAGDKITVRQDPFKRRNGGYYEIAWPGAGFTGYNQPEVSWNAPHNGVFIIKIKGNTFSMNHYRRTGYGMGPVNGLINKISWYEPERNGETFSINNSVVLRPDR